MDFSVLKKVDNLGRIVLPKSMREYYDMSLNGWIKLIPTDSGILITKCNENKNEAKSAEFEKDTD